ncbi:MAG TPA: radical SAM protein [Candidatus Lokiarchaeia archaeon]|nr:radical SAM protein [Candidatus Lokiarchaeia archaeon]
MTSDKRILLVNPSRTLGIYESTKILVPTSPNLTLATLAAPLLSRKQNVQIIDLSIEKNVIEALKRKLREFTPTHVGITIATTTFKEMLILGKIIKRIDPEITLLGGGPHASVLPEQTMKESLLDVVVVGEGDYTLLDIMEGKPLEEIQGIFYKQSGNIFQTSPRPLIENLDALPFPAWDLYDLTRYKSTRSITRKWPVGFIETSRGCPYGCIFCSKNIFGRKFRAKSPKRVVDEMEHLLLVGFKEIHPQDDCFSMDLDRAKQICELIIKRKLEFPWIFGSGIRADKVDEEFLRKAKQAGCYRVHFGVESASPQLLKNIKKGETINQIVKAVQISKKIGLETATYFIFGLPGESEKTMKRDIDLAIQLGTDLSRVAMLVPYPGTPIYEEWERKGIIKSKDWNLYGFHADMSMVYSHPDVDMGVAKKYYDLFYRRFYLRPSYILKRGIRGLIHGFFFEDAKYFVRKYLVDVVEKFSHGKQT